MRYEHTQSLGLKVFNNFIIKDSDDDTTYTDIPKNIVQRADIDGAWKHALEILFFEFLQLFVPDIYDLIDHNIEPESKETELNELLINTENTKRIVDKLVKVKFKDGDYAYLLIHIEVQSQVKTYKQQLDFAARMYEYNKILTSKFPDHQHINIGVLINSTGTAVYSPNKTKFIKQENQTKQFSNANESANYQKTVFSLESTRHKNLDYLTYKIQNALMQQTTFRFPIIHLAKWLEQEEKLKALAHSNAFAIIVLYQLVALKHPTKSIRNNAKIELIKLTREYNYTNKLLRELIYLIDMMIALPEDLNIEFYNEVKTMEAEVKERFVSIFERMARREALVEGQTNMLLNLLTYKFDSVPDSITNRIKSANLEQIEAWSLNFVNAQTIDEVFGD